jgi:putative phosphoribosyl transferase
VLTHAAGQAPWTGALPVPVARWLVRPPGGAGVEQGPWADRGEAGRVLGQRLGRRFAGRPGASDAVVLGVSGHGLRVAAEVAAVLGAPLDLLLVLPLAVPDGGGTTLLAVAGAGPQVHLVRPVPVPASKAADVFDEAWAGQVAELVGRERAVRAGLGPVALQGRVVVLAVDALTAGPELAAAVRSVRRSGPAHVLVAAPAGTQAGCAAVAAVADEVLCAWTPASAATVEHAYRHDDPASPERERSLLLAAAGAAGAAGAGAAAHRR